ncbi:MAG: hypothetical protein RIR62_2942 [Pseudomonadota bacterium]
MTRLFLLLAALLPLPVLADTPLRLDFAYLDAPEGTVLPAPEVTVTDLLGGQTLPVTLTALTEGATGQQAATVLPDALFRGPYARLRVAVAGLRLPPGDSQSDEAMTFAFEIVLRRDSLPEAVDLRLPVVTSSRRGAMKPYMQMPEIVEDLPDRFFMALQWMSLYRADEAAVAASPRSFALHRLISRAVADFAISMAGDTKGAVLILPAVELRDTLRLYWQNEPDGRAIHLRAYADARTTLWLDLSRTPELLSAARRAGVNAPAFCNEARALLEFFATFKPAEDEAAKVDSMFPNPGTLAGYIAGRQLDVLASCTRLRI